MPPGKRPEDCRIHELRETVARFGTDSYHEELVNRELMATRQYRVEGWEGWDDYAPFYDWENARTVAAA